MNPSGIPPYPTPETTPTRRSPTALGWVVVVLMTVAWVAVLVTPAAFAISVARPRDGGIPAGEHPMLEVACAAAVAATVLKGAVLGVHRLWWGIPAAAVTGVGLLAGAYIAAFVILQPNNPGSDNAAGAGVVILGVPTFVVLLALIAAGYGTSRGIARIRARPA